MAAHRARAVSHNDGVAVGNISSVAATSRGAKPRPRAWAQRRRRSWTVKRELAVAIGLRLATGEQKREKSGQARVAEWQRIGSRWR